MLLAELDGMRLSPRLRRLALSAGTTLLEPAAIHGWTIAGGDDRVPSWLERLAAAAPRLLTERNEA